jgi:hypothetical protein
MEVIIDTAQDAACVPGGSVAGGRRFALFDTSELLVPDFAKIGRRPDLAAFSGIAYPYAWATVPSALVLGRSDPVTYGAAGTLLSRLAIQAGRILAIEPVAAASVADRPALFVGAISQIPVATLAQIGISQAAQTDWRDETRPTVAPVRLPGSVAPGAPGQPGGNIDDALAAGQTGESTDQTFDRWRTELGGGGGWSGQVSALQDWLQRTFDISFASLRLRPESPPAYVPSRRMTLVVGQSPSPAREAAWTLVTAPSEASLASGIAAIVDMSRWQSMTGRITTYSAATDKVETLPIADYDFVQTRAFTLSNIRLVAANWLSSNILFYAFGLVALCGILGLVTTSLLWRLGRPS